MDLSDDPVTKDELYALELKFAANLETAKSYLHDELFNEFEERLDAWTNPDVDALEEAVFKDMDERFCELERQKLDEDAEKLKRTRLKRKAEEELENTRKKRVCDLEARVATLETKLEQALRALKQ
jgi:hypothetical protein